mgnify:CR=1 FL=1
MNFADPKVAVVFAEYEARDAAERERQAELGPGAFGLRDEYLLPVGRDVGGLLHALILAREPKRILELGTSYGYSTVIMADAAKVATSVTVSMAASSAAPRCASALGAACLTSGPRPAMA